MPTVPILNEEALTYWKTCGYDEAGVDATVQGLDNALAMKVTILSGRRLELRISRKVDSTHEGHAPAVLQAMRWVLTRWGSEHPTGSLIFWLEDGFWGLPGKMSAPIVAFARHSRDRRVLLMPDAAFLTTAGYVAERCQIDDFEARQSWRDKLPNLYWRGASSGLVAEGERWREAPRMRVVQAAIDYGDPTVLDARFTRLIDQPHNSSAQTLAAENVLADPVPFSEFLRHRYLIDADGESCAWRSFFLKLYSRSLVLKVRSDLEQWYYSELQEGQHYIGLDPDLANLRQVIEEVRRNPDWGREIAEEASRVMRRITFEGELERFAATIEAILGCHRA